MVRIGLIGALALAAMAPGVAWAQFRPLPNAPYYAISPSAPLAPRADSPATQQILQNYRSQLQQTQGDMLQRNPSGLGRNQLDVGRQLNAVSPSNSPLLPSPAAPAASPSYNLAPFSPSGMTSPPFNAGRP